MNRLWVRLTAAFLFVALAALIVFAAITSQTVASQFRGYVGQQTGRAAGVQIAGVLQVYYAENGSWQGVAETLPQPGTGQGPGMGRGRGAGMGAGMGGSQPYVLFDANGRYITGTDADRDTSPVTEQELDRALPIESGEQVVGWLVMQQPAQVLLDAAATDFLSQMRRTLALLALIVSGLALVVGLAISQIISRPLDKLTGAARAVTAGKLGEQVTLPPGQAAEIATLAESFNQMSAALAQAEAQRKRLTADIAHELRTPISVVRAQLQAMLDGVHPTDPAHVASVYEQTLHLSRLVDDLHTLTRAESGHLPLHLQPLDLADLARRVADRFEPLVQDAGLTLSLDIESGVPEVRGDGDRLHQVTANLLSNALRHTLAGGKITLSVQQAGDAVRVSVTNTGTSLTPEQAKHVFERFWRADESRRRDGSGAGLGLAISRELIHLHGGRIWVDVEPDQTRFTFELPQAVAASARPGSSSPAR